MHIEQTYVIHQHNKKWLTKHIKGFGFIKEEIPHVEEIIEKLQKFQIAIPSWALGTGGTRFGS